MMLSSRWIMLLLALLILPNAVFALNQNNADVLLGSDLKNMDIVINPGGSGCPSGQYWDIGRGGCTTEVLLRSVAVSESCACGCPSGTTGFCSMQRNGSYDVFGWRLPTAGNELISRYGATNWGSCFSVSNNCVADPDSGDGGGGGDTGGGTPPPPGTTLFVIAFICDASNPNFASGSLDSGNKMKIIGTYQRFSSGSRCPELAGFIFWQDSWSNWARQYQAANPGTSWDLALLSTFSTPTQEAMDSSAAANGEGSPEHMAFLNGVCSNEASAKYGVPLTATYIIGSGSTCVVN